MHAAALPRDQIWTTGPVEFLRDTGTFLPAVRGTVRAGRGYIRTRVAAASVSPSAGTRSGESPLRQPETSTGKRLGGWMESGVLLEETER